MKIQKSDANAICNTPYNIVDKLYSRGPHDTDTVIIRAYFATSLDACNITGNVYRHV